MRRIAAAFMCALFLFSVGFRAIPGDTRTADTPRRMSFHNRLLLNRAVLAGLRSMEVLLLVKQPREVTSADTALSEVAAAVAKLGGRVRKTEGEVGYLRIEVAPERLIELLAFPNIEAYQISALSKGAWYRDGPPISNALNFRGFEVTPVAATEPADNYAHLPTLTPAEARAPGFTADDVGVGEWIGNHPTWDGRGVTIASVETGQPSFSDPVFRTAKTLDGRDVPKIAGVLNAIDPEYDDETRVRLTTRLEESSSWTRVGNRTYILPRPGTYWMGTLDVPAGANVVHRFAVIEDDVSREIWIDANGDASFQDETPLADVNERFDPRVLKVTYPRKVDVSFVMSRARQPHTVHIYLGTGEHQSMTASVAAGNGSDESLASGVAPNARVLFVRIHGSTYLLANAIEGFLQAAKRPDVDVLTASSGLSMVPDTDEDFVGLLFRRLVTTYRKPIVMAAGNFGLMLGQAHSFGGALSVGGTLGPATYAALFGGRPLPGMIVHHFSAAGPALDGAVKPDFLAPMERIAATPAWLTQLEATPQNAPTRRIPPGYEVSCCTSASSPYAAGVVAMLISAARQSNIPYSSETLGRAMRVTARPIPGFPAHQQGNGALDVNAAWRELARPFDPPRITASAAIVHPLAQYAARGPEGSGILEFEGWTAGMKGWREIRLRRESGPRDPVTYRLRWSADDGTFRTPPSVTLPLNETVPVRVNIDVKTSGAHSGLLTLLDAASDAVAFRTQATIVATEEFDATARSLELKRSVGLLQQNVHYLHVPPGVAALAFEVDVTRGAVQFTIVQSHGLTSNYYGHVHPGDVFRVGPGRHQVLIPNPEPGTWALRVRNDSWWWPAKVEIGPREDVDADYTAGVRVLGSSILGTAAPNGGASLDILNEGSLVAEPAIEAWPGTLRSHRAAFRQNGLANLVEIDVTSGAQALSLQLRSNTKDTNTELFLYDCTTGECFSYDVAFPAARSQTLMVRKPAVGRWVAAVNAAPFPTAGGSFVLDEVITTGRPLRRTSPTPLQPRARWRAAFDDLPASAAAGDRVPIAFFELLDLGAERGEAEHPWNTHPLFTRLRDRPVALGTAIYRH